jgi:hypothetical protein
MKLSLLAALGMLTVTLYASSADATYVFTRIDYQVVNGAVIPGGNFTVTWGINDSSQVAMEIANGNVGQNFIYQGGTFLPLPVPPSGVQIAPVGINNAAAVVGGAFPAPPSFSSEQGFILSGGHYNFFAHPGWPNTEARAIGKSGLVTGIAYTDLNSFGGSVGFIYNPATGVFTDIAPVPLANAGFVIAQGINAAGQVVGSYRPNGGDTAFLRQPDGTIETFRVNNMSTLARGINDNGLITGFVGSSSLVAAFVGDASGFQLLSCPATVCPGVTATFGEGINNLGQIVGGWVDSGFFTHGFIATPVSLPTGTTTNGAYTFTVDVIPNVMIFIDPAVSLGFDYEIGDGDPKFASVQLPIGIGDSRYTLIVHGQAFALAGGDTFDFAAHGFANGVAQFRVADIEASAALDPNNAAAFPTGLTFTAAGTFSGTMTPLCRSTPLPAQSNATIGRGLSPCLSQ